MNIIIADSKDEQNVRIYWYWNKASLELSGSVQPTDHKRFLFRAWRTAGFDNVQSFSPRHELIGEWEELLLPVQPQLLFFGKEGGKKSQWIWNFFIFVCLWIADERYV